MKKVFAFLLVCMLCIGMCACAVTPGESVDPTAPGEPIETPEELEGNNPSPDVDPDAIKEFTGTIVIVNDDFLIIDITSSDNVERVQVLTSDAQNFTRKEVVNVQYKQRLYADEEGAMDIIYALEIDIVSNE